MFLRPLLLHWTNGYPNLYGKANHPDLNLEDYYVQKTMGAWTCLTWKNITGQLNYEQWLLFFTIWVGMEQSECPDTPLDSFPFLNLDHCGKNKITNIWVKNTLKTWSVVRKKWKLPMTISRAMRIASNSECIPARLDRCFERWREMGIVVLDQLFEGGVLKSFEQLKEKYELPNQDFYRYLQIRHYLHTHQEWEELCIPPSKIEHFFISAIEGTVKAKFISHLYRILQEGLKENNLDIKEKWELEMNIIISDEQWENSCEQGHKVTSSPNWREFGWKIKMRYFRTPLITSKWSNTSAQCWRGCGKVGDHTHIFWGLSNVIRILAKSTKGNKNMFIYRHTVTLEPSHFILGILPDNLEENSQTKLLRAHLLIAKISNNSLLAEATAPHNNPMEGKNSRYVQDGTLDCSITTENRGFHKQLVPHCSTLPFDMISRIYRCICFLFSLFFLLSNGHLQAILFLFRNTVSMECHVWHTVFVDNVNV